MLLSCAVSRQSASTSEVLVHIRSKIDSGSRCKGTGAETPTARGRCGVRCGAGWEHPYVATRTESEMVMMATIQVADAASA